MQKNKLFAAMLVAMALFAVSSCSLTWGKRLEFNGGELYYTSKVTEEEANRLGNYLTKAGFYDGNEKTVQITMNGTTYEFRMVIKKGLDEDQEYIEIAKLFAEELSYEVFNGSQVDIHFCNEQLKTLRVVPRYLSMQEVFK